MPHKLQLPIPSRHERSSPYVPYISEVDAPVETSLSGDIQDLLRGDGTEEGDINAKILQAQMNAERNRIMVLGMSEDDEIQDVDGTLLNPSPTTRHIRFGSESALEYDDSDASPLVTRAVHESKGFDGNRSGRPSVKA